MNVIEKESIFIYENMTLLNAIELIDKNLKGILLVVDNEKHILGTLTDGDIRRCILLDKSVDTLIKEIYNKNCTYVEEKIDLEYVKRLFIEKGIKFIPVIDSEKRVIGYHEVTDFINYSKLEKENPVLIMAGGLGTRLKPLTDENPKPMLKVGDKPILQTIIEQFRENGFKNILISVNYKADIIENYFRDGKDFGVSIRYIREKNRMGTGGAIKLAESYLKKPFFVINGDILTNTNFYNFMQFHVENQFSMSVGTRKYEIQVPYGVLNTQEKEIVSLMEKPVYEYFINAGMYILNPDVIEYIPENQYYDITELIDNLIKNNRKIGNFPITDYWMDIGRIEDYYKANTDIGKYF